LERQLGRTCPVRSLCGLPLTSCHSTATPDVLCREAEVLSHVPRTPTGLPRRSSLRQCKCPKSRVTDVHFTVSHRQPKLIAMDKQPDDDVMHLGRAGKAERLAYQTFDPGAQRQVLPLNWRRVALARLVRIRLEMPRVRAPRVRIIARDAKRFQQSVALQKHLVFATSQDVRQDVTTTVIKLVPEPKKRTTRDQPSSTPPR
jgi:hypothetical protein